MIPYYDSIEGSYYFDFYIPLQAKQNFNFNQINQIKEKNVYLNFNNNNNNLNKDINSNNASNTSSENFQIFNEDVGIAFNSKLEVNYALVQFFILNLFFLVMIISLILTILKNPGDLENKYVSLKIKIKKIN